MTERIDYTKVAEKLNYPLLEKKLNELSEKTPTRKRKRAADLLAPVTDKLLELHGKGWSYEQLAAELKTGGLPITVSALRAHLTQAAKAQKSSRKAAASKA